MPRYQFDAVVQDCTAALEIDPKYVKVLMRRAGAYEELEMLEEAYDGTFCICFWPGHDLTTLLHLFRLCEGSQTGSCKPGGAEVSHSIEGCSDR